ncbi:MAG: aminotransferase class I/II-fold pyridoxal phosphate-dependent enzyme [Bacteroidetes bacterium]|nr:aminotransferase class I/II-fold pyridoxal phosphate-dependent enzyme [Bacteroidota bacterium]
MAKNSSFIDTIDQIITDGVKKGILHLNNEDEFLEGNLIKLKGKDVVNFGSCSYLGLEFDRRLKDGAIDAIEKYGTQFSESRAYVSIKLYKDLEEHFEKIFKAHVLISPTTTLGHIAAIPVLVSQNDAVIIDHQAHNSIQTACNLLKPKGIHVELVRHNRLDLLEEKIKELKNKHEKIWYMADGIYSMYGDACPVKEIYALMDKYKELNLYVDDAHGMSCFGINGSGYVMSFGALHPRAVLAVSLAKAFATGGAVLVFPDKELARKVRTCGGPLITSGPMQPSALGAALASAKIHLSDEIYELQNTLQDNIQFARLMIKKYGLPIISASAAPVFFIGVSLPKLGYNMVHRMLNEGYYLNLGIFPAVPMKNTGIRFTITCLHTFSQIEKMIERMAHHLTIALNEEEISMNQIYSAFKLPIPSDVQIEEQVVSILNAGSLVIEKHKTIHAIEQNEWDNLLGANGSFDWNGLQFLERSFTNNKIAEENWEFDYLMVRDENNKIILATFLTTAIWKDDMLSHSSISAQVEEQRINDPYFLTSKVVSIGSLLTEGEHLFLDKNSAHWKSALQILFKYISQLQEKYEANNIMIRDFISEDPEIDSYFIDNGYFKINMPNSYVVDDMNWKSTDEYLQRLSSNGRYDVKRYVLRDEDKFEVKIITDPSEKDLEMYYNMYLNVKNNSLTLNTFNLPFKAFKNMISLKQWDITTLSLKTEFDIKNLNKPLAVMFCYVACNNYVPMILGLDYSYHKEYRVYKQAMYSAIKRAKNLNCTKMYMGFAADSEKKMFGAKPRATYGYMQTKENYNLEVLGSYNAFQNKQSTKTKNDIISI